MQIPFFKTGGQASTNRKIFRAAVTVAAAGLLAKGGLAMKELIVARAFGRGDDLDAFLIAFVLPSFMLNLVMGSLGAAFVPAFVDVRQKKGVAAAQKLLSSVAALSLAVMVVMAVLLGVLAPYYLPMLASSFSPQKLHLTRELLYWILPFILFSGLSTFVSAVLNAGEKFALPAVVPLVTPLVTIFCIWLGAGRFGAFALAVAVTFGSLLEAALLARSLRAHGLALRLGRVRLDPALRAVLSQYAPMFAGSFLMCSTTVVDQAMAAMLPGGSVAALSYANKTVGLVLAVCATALSTATLPYFSQMAAKRDWNGCRNTLRRYSTLVFGLAMPFTLVLIVFSKPLVQILFQRGAFNNSDTALVSRVQAFYAIQVPFYICGMLFVRFLSAVRRNDFLMYGSAISLILDVALNLLFMRIYGVSGIALSTSLVYVFAFFFLGGCTIRVLSRQIELEAAALDEEPASKSATENTVCV